MKFLLDSMLGKLAKWLRICGFDTEYVKDSKDTDLYFSAKKEDRILLTRDNKYKNLKTIKMCFINHDDLDKQIKQLFFEFNITKEEFCFFSRCTVCNKLLKDIDKEEIIDKIPPYTAKTKNEFSICAGCGRIYWTGTHYERMRSKLNSMLE
ncbi:MAG: Mut7-C RNAse domain-containing protein [Armatimonadota bacterium]